MKREAATGFTYLPARTLENLKGIELVARSLVEGALLGLHRSPYHGFSSEFAGDRKYVPGDSIRYLASGAEVPISTSWTHSDYPDIVFADLGADPVLPDPVDTVLAVKLR